MKIRAFFMGLVLLLSVPSMGGAEVLGAEAESAIQAKLNSLKVGKTLIDLNVRISIPANTAAGIGGVDLFGTLVRSDTACDPLYAEGKPYGRPTIVIATPYRREFLILLYLNFLNYDYNVLAVDVRGTGSSSGDWVSFAPEEHFDLGYVIDRYIPEQPWSDGRVGMIGPSYMAISQLLAAGRIQSVDGIPTHLKALFPIVPMSDVYRDIVMHGGNLDLEFIPMWLGLVDILGALPPLLYAGEDTPLTPSLANIKEASDIWTDHINNIPVTLGWILSEDNINKNDFYDTKSTMIYWPDKPAGGWNFGAEYPPGLGNTVIPENLPVFLIGGWFDIFTRGTINDWRYGLKNHTNADKAMIVGPWYHIDGSMGLGMKGLLNNEIAARWFDWKIKGITDPFMIEYPVLIYVLGEERWRAEKSWPLPAERTQASTLYLSKKKAAVSLLDSFSVKNRKNNYAMVETPAKDDYYNSYWLFKTITTPKDNPVLEHDPNDLHGGKSRSSVRWLMGMQALLAQVSKAMFKLDIDAGQYWEDERDDEVGVLTFTTDTLTEDVEISGPLTLTFWAKTGFGDPGDASSTYRLLTSLSKMLNIDEGTSITPFLNKRDVQWVVELNDVFKNGRARNITSGWLSAENRPYDVQNPTEVDRNYVAFDPFYDRSYKEPDPILADTVYKYVVEVWPTDNVFKKGHKIRISLSASDYPHLFPVFYPSENTIVIDDDHKARLDYTKVTGTSGAVWVDDPTEYVMNSLH